MRKHRRLSNGVLAHLLLIGVVAVWGSTFPLVKGALNDASPMLFNVVRMAIATVALVLINHRQLKDLSRSALLAGLIAGVLLGAGYQFQTVGLALTSATRSALITGLVVVIVPGLSLLPGLSSPQQASSGWITILGSLLAFIGLALLTTTPGAKLAGLLSGINRGDLLTLVCAFAFAGHLLALAKYSSGVAAGLLATLQIGFATLFMLLWLPFETTPFLHLTPRLIIAWLITALLATAAAFTIQSWAQQHLPATNTALLLSLEPVFALIASRILLGEQLSRRAAFGAVLILSAISVLEFFGLSRPIPPEPMA